ncbi:unnamed protein product [Polarella glacialis]|uniref:Uncharacterized protein n=1 Tax=Polarella glacialis TaxID=89957 RepID=A0A813J7Q3_POLGL|nr:unnamed protein product [Polarella glacialis]
MVIDETRSSDSGDVGLALLRSVSDILQSLDACDALTFLKKFVRLKRFEPEVLLSYAESFEVSHRMLSDLEAAYSWEPGPSEPKLILQSRVSGALEWSVERQGPIQENLGLASAHGDISYGRTTAPPTNPSAQATVLPFLLHNLDTGETTVLQEEWNRYVQESDGPSTSATPTRCRQECPFRGAPHAASRASDGGAGGSFWSEGRQRQALHALGKA